MGVLWDCLAQKLDAFSRQCIQENGVEISYHALYAKVMSLSKFLVKKQKYGILCNNETNSAVGILACLAAGAVTVPMSVRYGAVHRDKIIEAMRISWMITDGEIRKVREEIPEQDDLSNTAFILSTSGTTGEPKGVKLSEENILCNLQAIQAYFQITPCDRMLIIRPLFHVSALTGEFLLSLYAGAEIIFAGGGSLPIAAAKTVVAQNVSVLCATPTLLRYMCGVFERMQCAVSLRKLALSGECLSEEFANRLPSVLPDTELFNVYGLTEASPRISALLPEFFAQHPTSVGKPIQGVDVKLMDGSLWVRGFNVMQGYYLNPEASSEKTKDGWLYTGDMAEMDADGFLYIKGRADDMMIRAGMNLYPQEIENALLCSPSVHEALVYMQSGKIIAKIVGNADKQDILLLCREKLPAYAVPEQVEFVNALPKNAAGKLVRHG